MVELEFMTLFAEPGDTVLYAGAAPSTPLPLLARLFPSVSWVLYDPRPFDEKLVKFAADKNHKVKIFNELFTNDVIKRWNVPREKTLFMSDIRTADHTRDRGAVFEQKVEQDNQMQIEWYYQLQPKRAILKYRPPYSRNPDQVTSFLDGEIFLQPWTKSRSGEVRVVPTSGSLKNVRLGNFEDLMATHNLITRVSRYPLGANPRDFGVVDECFDCSSEVNIWEQYLRKMELINEDTSVGERALQIKTRVLQLNAILSNGRFNLENFGGTEREGKE
jgi:hypothetical protein